MSLIASAVEGRPAEYYFALANNTSTSSAKNWYLYPSENGTVQLVDASGTQLLQSIDGQLFYNDQLLASASSIQNISDWSLYPVLNSTGVNFNGYALRNASSIQSGAYTGSTASISSIATASLLTSMLEASTASISSLSGVNFSLDVLNVSTISTNYINVNGGLVDHVNSITLSQTSTYGTLTSPDGDSLLWNGSNISGGVNANWALSPANSTIRAFPTSNLNLQSQNCNVNINAGNSINLNAPVNASTINVSSINGAVYDTASHWSYYPQLSNLNTFTATQQCNANINVSSIQDTGQNLKIISGSCNISMDSYYDTTIHAGGSMYLSSYYTTNVSGTDVNVTAATNSAINTPTVTVSAAGGPIGGNVTVAAYAGNVPTTAAEGYGRVSLQAYGSSNAELNLGGLIDITAYSGSLPVTLLSGTSALRMNAAAVNMSAGYVNAIPSFAGSWTAYATNIASIVTGPIPGVFPQVPGTVYIYGFGGVRLSAASGSVVQSLVPFETTYLQADFINGSSSNVGTHFTNPLTANVISPSPVFNPISGLDLYIRGSNADLGPFNISTFVRLEDVRYCTFMAQGGAISNLSSINNFTVTPDSLSGLSSLSISSINGYQFPQVAPASSTISTFNQIYTSSIGGLVDSIYMNGPSSITMDAALGMGKIIAGDQSLSTAFLEINNQNSDLPELNFAGMFNDVGGVYLGRNNNLDFSYGSFNAEGTHNIVLEAPIGNVSISANSTINLSSGTFSVVGSNIVQISSDPNLNGPYFFINGVTSSIAVSNNGGATYLGNDGGGDSAQIALNVPGTNSNGIMLETPFGLVQLTNLSTTTALSSFIVADSTGGLYKTGLPSSFSQLYTSSLQASTISAVGDVVANSAGSTPYSLSTVYGLVKGNQSYNYWVSVNGSDTTGTGSAVAPFASISGALAATASIPDSTAVNVCIAAGTYTESPTVTRNNTFLIGPSGVSDVVIVGTLSFIPGATTATSIAQGASGLTVVGNVVCSETSAIEVNWFLSNVNVTSYGSPAVSCTGDTSDNTSITLNSCILTQNVTANACMQLVSCRANLTLVSMVNNTTSPCLSLFSGNSSVNASGTNFTAAGSASAGAIVFVNNTITPGSVNSFTNCSFIYLSGVSGSAKTAVQFSNNVNIPTLSFNYCVFSVAGSTNIISKPGSGTVLILWGHNTCTSVSSVPPASATLVYSYSAQDFIRANTIRDSANSAGTANQVLTAGPTGGSLVWAAATSGPTGAAGPTGAVGPTGPADISAYTSRISSISLGASYVALGSTILSNSVSSYAWGLGTVLIQAGANNSSGNFYITVGGQTGPIQSASMPSANHSQTVTLSYRTPAKIGPTGSIPIIAWGQLSTGTMSVTATTEFGLANIQ